MTLVARRPSPQSPCHSGATRLRGPGSPLTRFARGSRGSVSLELVLSLPLLLWALVATVVFYEGYQARYHAQMAAQTVADVMSRQTDLFTADYIEGLNDVFDFLADSRYETRIRVSSVIWDSANERNRLQWSYGTRNLTALPEDTFALMQAGDYEALLAEFGEDDSFSFTGAAAQMPVEDLADRIPPVLPGEALLLVESFALWEPFANVGVGQLRFTPVIVVRPRFAPWINFEGIEPIFPEANYEIAWAGGGNDALPDPNEDNGDDNGDGDGDDIPAGQVMSYSFDDGVTAGFSQNTIASGGPTGSFLGLFGTETYANPVTLDVRLPSAGSIATIEFDLIVVDSWDAYHPTWAQPGGDNFTILLDGAPISLDPFTAELTTPFWRTRSHSGFRDGATYGVTMTLTNSNSNFYGSYFNDQIWHVVVTLNNAPQNFQLGFSSLLNEAIYNESWGLDNLAITASGSGSAAPFTPNAADLLSADTYTRFRRYRGCPEYRIPAQWLAMSRSDLATGVTMTRRAAGVTNLSYCSSVPGLGYINASPSLILNYDNEGISSNRHGLQIRMNDGNNGYTCDTTLAIRDPNGQWFFNDDYTGYNAGLRITNAPAGQYVIFVGTYGGNTCDSQMTIDQWVR